MTADLVLAVDASARVASCALARGAELLVERQREDPLRHAEELVPLIDETLAAAGARRAELALVVSGVGPGSFTGVRVTLATAKGIALGLGIPLVGVGSLEAMGAAAGVAVVAVLDARKDEVYFAPVSAEGDALVAEACVPRAAFPAAVASWLARGFRVVGEVARELGVPGDALVELPGTSAPRAAAMARVGLARWRRHGPADLDALEPRYVRPPDVHLPAPPPAI